MSAAKLKPRWADEPTEENLQAATDYLSLCGETINAKTPVPGELRIDTFDTGSPLGLERMCSVRVTHLPTGETGKATARSLLEAKAQALAILKAKLPAQASDGPHLYKAKDILRAARLPLLPQHNPNVLKHLDRWQRGRKTNPVLLRIREGADARPLEVADGYHRVCAAYWVDENTEVRCFIV